MFRELPEHQLSTLSDERLVDYMRAARESDCREAMKPAIAVLVYGYWDILVNRARLKLPEVDAEDVAGEAAASAIAAAFEGRSVGEFRAFLNTILSRRIADYHEARKRRVTTTQLPSEHERDEGVWVAAPAAGFEGDALFAEQCLARVYEELEDDRHRQAIDLYLYGPKSAAECATIVGDGMTDANVHQIASRFQRRFGELLREGDVRGPR